MEITGRKYAALFADFTAWVTSAAAADNEFTVYCDISSIMIKQPKGYILFSEPSEICAIRHDACFGKYFKYSDYDAIEYWYQDVLNYMK